jgi:hypothetical protein
MINNVNIKNKLLLMSSIIIVSSIIFLGCSRKEIIESSIKTEMSIPAAAEIKKENINKEVQRSAAQMDLNSYVLKTIATYEVGNYPYLLNNDYENYNGVTETIAYQGATIAKSNPDGSKSSHCVGLTFEVFYKAMQQRNKELGLPLDNFNSMTTEDMKNFLLTWYAALGTPKSQGDQLAGAIVKYGLGTQITNLEEVREGDFIDFSRINNSGHTAVFINWLRDDSKNIIGFKYWSTQTSTNGINYKEEYFSDNASGVKGLVDKKHLYIGRVGPVESYRPLK